MICIVRTRTLHALHATCAQHQSETATARDRVTELEAAEASARVTATAATVEADRLRDRLTRTEIALTSTRAELASARTGAVRADQEHLEQQDELLSALGAIVEKLSPTSGSPSSAAVAEALTLATRYVPAPDPVEEAKVWVALRRGPGRDRILSVHPSEEGARAAVEREGACPKGWQGLTWLDHPLEERWSSFSGWQVRGVPVEGCWPDTSTVALIVNGVAPLAAYGEQFDAYEALDNAAHEARQAGSTVLTEVQVHRVVQPQPTGGGN